MKSLIIAKQNFDQRPPLISLRSALIEMNYSVDILALNIADENLFNKNGTVYNINSKGFFNKVFWFFRFLVIFHKLIRCKDYDVIILHGGDLIYRCGMVIPKKTIGKPLIIMQINELYDRYPKILKSLKKNKNKFDRIVVPELNRAYILKSWLDLKILPSVLLNKPYPDIVNKNSTINSLRTIKTFKFDAFKAAILSGKKLLIYQGILNTDRDLSDIAKYVSREKDYIFLILGIGDYKYLDTLLLNYQNIIYLGYIPPPLHLVVAKYCHVGIVIYDHKSLNRVFAAPNKIWEYSSQGLPFLYSPSPSLKDLLSESGFALECDFSSPYELESKLNIILKDDIDVVKYALNFYHSYDYLYNVQRIVNGSY